MNPIIICCISLIGSIFIYNAEKKSNISKILFVSVLSGFLFFQNCITENPLLFTNHDDYTELHNVIVGKDVAVYASKTPFLNNMIIPLRDTSHFYFDKITSDKKYNLDLPEKDFYIIVDETIFLNSDQSLVTYYNYIPGVENSEEFIKYVLTENADKYNISFVNEYIINRGLYSLYYLEPK